MKDTFTIELSFTISELETLCKYFRSHGASEHLQSTKNQIQQQIKIE